MKRTEQATRHRGRPSRALVASAAAAVVVVGLLVVAIAAPSGHNAAATVDAPASGPASGGRALALADASASSAATALAAATVTPKSPSASPRASASTASAPQSTNGGARIASGAAPLAGRIRPGVTYQGVATEYAAADGNGACLFGPAANMMIAAMNETDYESAKACGDHILVRAANGATITVLITNECPLPCAPGQLDLSQQAFVALAGANLGRMPITWQLLSPANAGTISVRYQTGSSQYWCAIQVINHRNPVATLEVRAAGAWQQLPRASYNYFTSAHGAGCGGAIRVTDIYGQQLVIDGIALSPNVEQPTQAQFALH